MHPRSLVPLTIVFALLAACRGNDGVSSLLEAGTASPADCPAGGQTLSFGLDLDADGRLSDEEIDEEVVICDGADGTPGTNGTNGTNGTDGVDGESRLVEYEMLCVADLSGFGSGATVYYKATRYSPGELVVEAGFTDHYINEVYSSWTSFEGDADYATGYTFLQVDRVGTFNGGFFEFETDFATDVVTAVYYDIDLANNSYTLDFTTPGICSSRTF